MAMALRIEQIGIDPRTYFRKALLAAHRDGLTGMAREWHDNILPKHFAPNARFVYKYAKRADGYVKKKGKAGKGNVDLVFSGRLRDYLAKNVSFRVTNKQATVRMSALPDYIGKSGKPMQVNRVQDPQAVIARLEAALKRTTDRAEIDRINVRLQSLRNSKTAGRYPDIKGEIVRNAKADVEQLLKRYDKDALASLKANPEAQKKTKRVLTTA